MRTVIYVSDGTGVTAQTLGQTLLTQFSGAIGREGISFPFVDDQEKAIRTRLEINRIAIRDGERPLVFSTMVDEQLKALIQASNACFLDLLGNFLAILEKELGSPAQHLRGLAHGASDYDRYMNRINAMNFALQHDDGLSVNGYGRAELILIGVSRVGKTPTSLYLALQHGIYVANYPLSLEEIEAQRLPSVLRNYRSKLYGLTLEPGQLGRIRDTRKPGSRYSSRSQVRIELSGAESLMQREHISFLDVTQHSVEEIAATLLQGMTIAPHGAREREG
jgi:regulator of PEP synthase PpsR (kinase-PPPase family)